MPNFPRLAGLETLLQFDNWPILVLGRVFDRKTGLVTYRKQGLEILVDHRGGDENGTRACIVSPMYRRHLAGLALSGPLRVLDLGANGGGFPLMLRLAGFDIAQVVCVEMNRPTWLRLMINLATNLNVNAIGLNAAVCGMPTGTEILLQPSRGSTSLSLNAQQTDASAPHISVPTITLADLCAQYFQGSDIDICKIDIEGAEYDALDAAPDEVIRKIRNLIIEFHTPAKTPACLSRLLRLGFSDSTGNGDARTSETTEVRVFRRAETFRQTGEDMRGAPRSIAAAPANRNKSPAA